MRVSVVVPVYNAQDTLPECLGALLNQSLDRSEYEIIVVDDGSSDDSASIAGNLGVRLVKQRNGGAGAARNTGSGAALGAWVAFTDADCVPSRGWLANLLDAVEREENGRSALGAAGRTVGFASETSAARFVDLMGSLDAQRHLDHPHFPFAPSLNVMYRRLALEAVGGFDERYTTYEACDLHNRLTRKVGGAFHYAPRAVILHRHRASWKQYWRQQLSYGKGYAQFMMQYADEIPWSFGLEARSWAGVVKLGLGACLPGKDDEALIRRGLFVKQLAQRMGFVKTYWSRKERQRWHQSLPAG
ncbi:MAG: glycosyltransferase [Candidatus Eremiobacteraeota bacterium]|nr:glycosyltransferase [Candidatus Eremiobacteraeota bacterium]